MKTTMIALAAMALGQVACAEVAADGAVLTNGFTLTLKVNLDGAKGDEKLYALGPMNLVLRQGQPSGYDVAGGNYSNFRVADGSCPVLEATICEKAGRVGIPLGCLPKPDGDHVVTLDFSPVRWSIGVDGRRDEDFPIPEFPVVWPSNAFGRVLSPRVRDVSFVTPAKRDVFPEPDARPITRSIQYWTPDDHNAWVGDVAPGTLNGTFHLFYLLDRRHHGSGVRTGRHQFAHLTSTDLVHWTEHPLAVPIRETWQSVGTGTPFLKDGKVAIAFGWHTGRFKGLPEGLPIGGTYATSEDGIHFVNSGASIGSAQNPSVYNAPEGDYLQIGSCGGSGLSRSKDLVKWERCGVKLPFGGDCPALFDWHGHRYLLQGFVNMAYAEDARTNQFVDWTKEPDVLYDGLSVPMVVPWQGDRRIYAGWMEHLHGWGGWLVFREVVYYPDGHLGLKWVPEIVPPTPPVAYDVKGGERFTCTFRRQRGGPAVVFAVNPETREMSFADDVDKPVFQQRLCWSGNIKVGGVRGIDKDYRVRLIAHYDAKSDATIFDAEVAGQRTLIVRRAGRYDQPQRVAAAIRAVTPDGWGGSADAWQLKRHEEKVRSLTNGPYRVVFVGDSITHNMEPHYWKRRFAGEPYRALNLGTCGDRTEHVLWRIAHGELDGFEAKCVVLLIGTNNTGHFRADQEPPSDTILGIREVLRAIRAKQPKAKVVLMPIFPRGKTADDPNRRRNDVVNKVICGFADGENVFWCDCCEQFLTPEGETSSEVFFDRLHPTTLGYDIWFAAVKPFLDAAVSDGRLPMPGNSYASSLGRGLFHADGPVTAFPTAKSDGWWLDRLLRNRNQIAESGGQIDLVFVGDSITHGWEGQGKEVLAELRKTYSVLNLGYGSDRTENVLWRLENGEMDGYRAKCVMLMIGTNNTSGKDEVALGIRRILDLIARKQPTATTLLLPIFPRGASPEDGIRRSRDQVNEVIKAFADGKKVVWVDFNAKFLDEKGDTKGYLYDRLHPNAAGYRDVWLPAVLPHFQRICGK